jgi:hypothetical protein
VEHGITFLLHVWPINIELGGNGVLPILDDSEVPIILEVVPKPMTVKLSGPIIRVFISVDHGLIFSPCEVHRHARVSTIHSPKGVLIIRLEWMLNLLNYATLPCFSCFSDCPAFGDISSFRISS